MLTERRIVLRQRDDPCQQCDGCASARYRGYLLTTTHPENIRTVNSPNDTRNAYILSVCVCVLEFTFPSLPPTSVF
jgi:hypothetical protein